MVCGSGGGGYSRQTDSYEQGDQVVTRAPPSYLTWAPLPPKILTSYTGRYHGALTFLWVHRTGPAVPGVTGPRLSSAGNLGPSTFRTTRSQPPVKTANHCDTEEDKLYPIT